MKRYCMFLLLLPIACSSYAQTTDQPAKDSFYSLAPVEVRAVRASDIAPFTRYNLGKTDLRKANTGMDIPFLLNQAPAVVANSDAGNGIGYTGIRIRGTDATRINVTLNGIPYNDAESQGTFFVDLPDFTSSTSSLQVQRGVGTSSNGAGAFGASIHFSTNEINPTAYAEINTTAGSFGTLRNTFKAGSGLVNGFTSEVRFSRIVSDGFIDRASSNLRSFFVTTAYQHKQSSVRLNVFSGKEKTYQAWYGISEADLRAGNRTVNYAGTEKPGSPYDNETDNYTQTHYQFFYNQGIGKRLQFSTALFLTEGYGYYEQYKADQRYAKYGMPDVPSTNGPITKSDMIRQLWLDNSFYGNVFSLQYKQGRTEATLGGSATRYDGSHFGKIIWAEQGLTSLRRWYDLPARKTDFTVYLKQQTGFGSGFHYFYDLQYRTVGYTMQGFRDNPTLHVDKRYHFFNPKAGLSYRKRAMSYYISYSVATKEPNRDDFEAGLNEQPRPEQLHDLEAGVESRQQQYSWSATLYYMRYKDQLVLTGRINDVGAYTRTNIPRSYRAGIELQGNIKLKKWLQAQGNLALSQNKVLQFEEYLDDYDNGGQQKNNFSRSDIAFSPAVVGAASVSFIPVSKLECSLINKYVSRQYLDNTGNQSRSLDPYYVQDFRVNWTILPKQKVVKWVKEIAVTGQVNNLWSVNYEPNGYTYSYISGGATQTENFYFPMAGRNVLVGVNLRF